MIPAAVARLALSALLLAASPPPSRPPSPPGFPEPFALSAAELRAAADAARPAAQATAAVDVLFRDVAIDFDEEGRQVYRRYMLYRLVGAEALAGWGDVEARWLPGYQDRPELRARVITARGDERRLDPAALLERSAGPSEGAPRVLRGRLPGVGVGALVEEELVLREHRPAFVAGSVGVHHLVAPAPLRHSRFSLSAPRTVPLRFGVRLSDLEPRRTVDGGRVHLVFSASDVAAAGPVEAGMPPARPRHPAVVFSTGADWNIVARTYSQHVDAAIARGGFAGLPEGLAPAAGVDVTARVGQHLEWLRARVEARPSTTGVNGEPRSPRATLDAGGGSSEDLATLLVAGLRADGIAAHVALLRASPGEDVEPELPGLGRFNQALVYIGSKRPLWVDPGDRFGRVGELASSHQGRLTLIAASGTERLVATPVSHSADNRTLVTIDVFLADAGPARIVETSEYVGAPERTQRMLLASFTHQQRRQAYEDYVRSAYRAEALGEVEESALDELGAPYRLRLEALGAGRAVTDGGEAVVGIEIRDLLTTLPRELLVARPPRQHAFVFQEPFVIEWRYRVVPPRGMHLRDAPKRRSYQLGTVRLEQEFRRGRDRVEVDLRLDTGPRVITAEQFEAVANTVAEVLAAPALVLHFER